MALALIGLGSNVGDRLQSLSVAVDKLRALAECNVLAVSTWRETVPAGGPADQAAYLNGCALLETAIAPETLLAELQRIESALGRRRDQAWGPRTIDLDLLLFDEVRCVSPALSLPHPRMAWRRFVIDPAAEIAPLLRHPVIGWTMAHLREHLKRTPLYVAIAGPIAAGKTTLAEEVASRHEGVLVAERFSSRRLAAFYADPAGQAGETELEFLAQRRADLARERDIWTDHRRPIVSDYWFDQSLAFACVWLPYSKLASYQNQWRQLREQVVPPRLVVFIDAPVDVLLERIRGRTRAGEKVLDAARLESFRIALEKQMQMPDVGPVMRLTHDGRAHWEEELSAAIVAMQ